MDGQKEPEATRTSRTELLDRLRSRRGFVLPVHELMADLDPEILRRYDEFASYVIFDPEPRALDLKTRFLVLVGITTAVKGDPDGVGWSTQRALENGATESEVLEAMVMAALPAGIPALEAAAKSWYGSRRGEG